MKKTKFTKEQIDAIELFIIDLDELDDKPHRFFSSLTKLAVAFGRTEQTTIWLKRLEDAWKLNWLKSKNT